MVDKRGQNISLDDSDDYAIIRGNNPNYPDIKFDCVHISCQSDKIQKGHRYGGVILYSLGNLTVKTGIRWKPAYVYIKETNTQDFKQSKMPGDEGLVHGTLIRQITGYQPLEIANAGGCTGGFSIETDSELKIVSRSCNEKGGYSDTYRYMQAEEASMVKAAVLKWKQTGVQNYYPLKE